MGVYIKGMEIPDSCRKCELFINCDDCEGLETRCAILGPIGYLNEIPNCFRHQNCPLVEVKPPHGRLKDVDKILNGEGRYVISFGKDGIDTEEINRSPTIIEAEAKT